MVQLARDEFDRLGARQWSIAALAELTRLGVGPATGEGLSGPERRVVDEVVRGATNPEVAGTLFISESTVEATLWRVYAKLGVRSRTELARLMAASSRPAAPRTRRGTPARRACTA
jgi:DNA-binding NarL/FixJ family response regulator